MNIFSYYEMANLNDLRSYGFITAADFTDINSNGLLKHRQKGWIKVPGIAKVRATQLNDWREKLELKEDLNISHRMHSTYQNTTITLNQSLSKLENEFKREIQPYQAEYEKQKQELILYKADLLKSLQEKNNHLKDKFDKTHLQLNDKCREQELGISTLLVTIANTTIVELNENLQTYTLRYLNKWKVINNYIIAIKIEIDKLFDLQKELKLIID